MRARAMVTLIKLKEYTTSLAASFELHTSAALTSVLALADCYRSGYAFSHTPQTPLSLTRAESLWHDLGEQGLARVFPSQA